MDGLIAFGMSLLPGILSGQSQGILNVNNIQIYIYVIFVSIYVY